MSEYVIVMYTDVENTSAISQISGVIDQLPEVNDWTIDLQDTDRVLRISSKNEISSTLQNAFQQAGVHAQLMAVFEENGILLNDHTYTALPG